MSYDKQIYWRQGLFLRPQHFQLQDQFHHSQLVYRWQLVQPNGWGVKLLRMNETSLQAELCEILECEVLTRDGWLLRFGAELRDGNCMVEPRSFKGLFDPGKGELSVYLAIPRRPHGTEGSGPETAASSEGLNGGLVSSAQPVRDLYDVELDPVDIDLVVRRARLLFDQEPGFDALKQAFHLIKIAELVRTGQSRAIQCSDSYIYPCLTIGSSYVLLSRLKELRDIVIAKLDEYAATKRQRGVRAAGGNIQDAIRLQIMQTFARYVPVLQHLTEVQYAHPEPIYGLLRQFVGELSVFNEEFSVLGAERSGRDWGENLPPYDHEDIRLRFQIAIERIVIMVRRIAIGPEAGIRLEYDGKQYYCAQLPDSFLEGQRNRYYLMIDSPFRGQELWANLQSTGKLTTLEDMIVLRKKFLFGLELTPLLVPPEELPQKGTFSYFQVNTQDETWKLICNKKNIALLAEELKPNETVIKLLVVRGEQ